MGKTETMVLRLQLDAANANQNLKALKTAVENSTTGDSAKKLEKTFESLAKMIDSVSQRAARGFSNQKEMRAFENSLKNLKNKYSELGQEIQGIDLGMSSLNMPTQLFADFERLKKEIDGYKDALKDLKTVGRGDIITVGAAMGRKGITENVVKKMEDPLAVKAALAPGKAVVETNLKTVNEELIARKLLLDLMGKQSNANQRLGQVEIDIADKIGIQVDKRNSIKTLMNLIIGQETTLAGITEKDLNKQIISHETLFAKRTSEYNEEMSYQKIINDKVQQQLLDEKAISNEIESRMKGTGPVSTGGPNMKDISSQMKGINKDILLKLSQDADKLGYELVASVNPQIEKFNKQLTQAEKHKSFFEGLTGKVAAVFSLGRAFQYVTDTVRKAWEGIQGLDKQFTEIAVVTDKTTSELWSTFGTYNQLAQKLGTSTLNAVTTSKLFYQQGLQTVEVLKLTEETMKMAKIAGMDFALATDYMTAAIRGFKMEMSEASKVNDIYSALAAKSAVDTREISYAMTKVASIAKSAGMEIESTSAFLTKMIETTREAPENIGTALKTIVARMQELKKNPIDIMPDENGDMINANLVEKALKSASVQLRDSSGQFKNLDGVLLELNKKWSGLDRNTQRYIATTIAGSRQQSRFLALMDDYDRTMQLVGFANDSAGDSAIQFSKTMDSIESKVAQLTASFEQFYMKFINSDFFKGLIDGTKTFINFLNQLPGPLALVTVALGVLVTKSTAKLFIKLGKNISGYYSKIAQFAALSNIEMIKAHGISISKNNSLKNEIGLVGNINTLSTKELALLEEKIVAQRILNKEVAMQAKVMAGRGLNIPALKGQKALGAFGEWTTRAVNRTISGKGAASKIPVLGKVFQSAAQGMSKLSAATGLGLPVIGAFGVALGVVAVAAAAYAVVAWKDAKALMATKQLTDAAEKSQLKYIASKKELNDTTADSVKLQQLESKTNKTEEETTKQIELSNKLAESYPQLIKSFDQEGNAILETGIKLDEIIAKKQELVQQNKILAISNREIAQNQGLYTDKFTTGQIQSKMKTTAQTFGAAKQGDVEFETIKKIAQATFMRTGGTAQKMLTEFAAGSRGFNAKLYQDFGSGLTEEQFNSAKTLDELRSKLTDTQKDLFDAINESLGGANMVASLFEAIKEGSSEKLQAEQDSYDIFANSIIASKDLTEEKKTQISAMAKDLMTIDNSEYVRKIANANKLAKQQKENIKNDPFGGKEVSMKVVDKDLKDAIGEITKEQDKKLKEEAEIIATALATNNNLDVVSGIFDSIVAGEDTSNYEKLINSLNIGEDAKKALILRVTQKQDSITKEIMGIQESIALNLGGDFSSEEEISKITNEKDRKAAQAKRDAGMADAATYTKGLNLAETKSLLSGMEGKTQAQGRNFAKFFSEGIKEFQGEDRGIFSTLIGDIDSKSSDSVVAVLSELKKLDKDLSDSDIEEFFKAIEVEGGRAAISVRSVLSALEASQKLMASAGSLSKKALKDGLTAEELQGIVDSGVKINPNDVEMTNDGLFKLKVSEEALTKAIKETQDTNAESTRIVAEKNIQNAEKRILEEKSKESSLQNSEVITDQTAIIKENTNALKFNEIQVRASRNTSMENFSGATTAVSDLAKDSQTPNSAIAEQKKYGEISVQTLNSLISANEEYSKAIEVKNGKIRLNMSEMKKLQKVENDAAKTSIGNSISKQEAENEELQKRIASIDTAIELTNSGIESQENTAKRKVAIDNAYGRAKSEVDQKVISSSDEVDTEIKKQPSIWKVAFDSIATMLFSWKDNFEKIISTVGTVMGDLVDFFTGKTKIIPTLLKITPVILGEAPSEEDYNAAENKKEAAPIASNPYEDALLLSTDPKKKKEFIAEMKKQKALLQKALREGKATLTNLKNLKKLVGKVSSTDGALGTAETEELKKYLGTLTSIYNALEEISRLEKKKESLLDQDTSNFTGTELKNYNNSLKLIINSLKTQYKIINDIKKAEQKKEGDKLLSKYKKKGFLSIDKDGNLSIKSAKALKSLSVEQLDILDEEVKTYNQIGIDIDSNKEKTKEYNKLITEGNTNLKERLRSEKEAYKDLTQQIIEALIERDQKEIDNTKSKYDAIKEEDDKYLSALRKNVDKQRALRDKNKEKDDLSSKEKRLALLKRDSSGAYKGEISSLEKEIADQRQSMSDSAVDSMITAEEEKLNLANASHDKEIQLMQEHQDEKIRKGEEYNREAQKIMKQGADAVLATLKTTDGFLSLNATSARLMVEDTLDLFNKARGYLKADEAVVGKDGLSVKPGTGELSKPVTNTPIKDTSTGNSSKGKGTGTSKPPKPKPKSPKKVSLVEELLQYGSTGEGVKSLQWALNKLKFGPLDVDGEFGNKTLQAVIKFQKKSKIGVDGKVGKDTKRAFGGKGYLTGGMVDYTGPAWVDGTKSSPEAFLSAKDTLNIGALRDVLATIVRPSGIPKDSLSSQKVGDVVYEINIKVDKIDNDYDVEKLAEKLKKEIVGASKNRVVNQIRNVR